MPADIITTDRLTLRSALPSDFEPLYAEVFSDLRVTHHLGGKALGHDEATKLFDTAFDHEGSGRKIGVLVETLTQEVLGYAGLKPFTALGEDDFEIGFVLKCAAWGRGYATEIGRGQLEYGFKTTNRPRMVAQVRPGNTASASALRKIGMRFLNAYERPELGTWDIYIRKREA